MPAPDPLPNAAVVVAALRQTAPPSAPSRRSRVGAPGRMGRMAARWRGFFKNTAGPCGRDLRYMVDPLRRIERLRRLSDRQRCVVIHGPRPTGKTTSLLSLAAALEHEGRYAAAFP
ncbi:hypothetical protein [Sorangium sp. So ce1024]|uniref:hypothetical protein n=1 Tax=Sorangium sp. So ce1024 TaxID=3133327 RepID=UPI003F03F09B